MLLKKESKSFLIDVCIFYSPFNLQILFVHSKAKCFSLGRSTGVEEARQEVKEHGQKTALCNGVNFF